MPSLTCVFTHAGTAQFQSCHDATGCGGNMVSDVSKARECCLGSGFSFMDNGTCRQCIGKQPVIVLGHPQINAKN